MKKKLASAPSDSTTIIQRFHFLFTVLYCLVTAWVLFAIYRNYGVGDAAELIFIAGVILLLIYLGASYLFVYTLDDDWFEQREHAKELHAAAQFDPEATYRVADDGELVEVEDESRTEGKQ